MINQTHLGLGSKTLKLGSKPQTQEHRRLEEIAKPLRRLLTLSACLIFPWNTYFYLKIKSCLEPIM